MKHAQTTLANIITIMRFISNIGTIYKVEPGPHLRLIESNEKAKRLGIAPRSFYGKRMIDYIQNDYYNSYILPAVQDAVNNGESIQFSAPSPNYDIHQTMTYNLTPITDDNEELYILMVRKYEYNEGDLEYLAFNDPLTGIPNRLFLEERIKKAALRYHHHQIPFSAMLIDCDKFKWINDHYGHDGGDQALVTVAQRLKNCIREDDVFARYGGDEFAVLLENCEGDKAIEIAERMIEAVQTPIMIRENACDVTISIGIAYSSDLIEDNILTRADRALYKVKSNGRNHFNVYSH